jgi:hypothetical protein
MSAVLLHVIRIALLFLGVQGMAKLENSHAAASNVNVLVDSRLPDQATVSARPRTGVSARQLSRAGVAPAGAWAVRPPAGVLAFSRRSERICVATHLPFCVTPRPPPLPVLF